MNTDQIAAEATDKIMEKQMTRGLIPDVAYSIIKAACGKAFRLGASKLLMDSQEEIQKLKLRAAQEGGEPEKGSDCVICETPISTYDTYGVSAKSNFRYHWDCVKREAATVSAAQEGEK